MASIQPPTEPAGRRTRWRRLAFASGVTAAGLAATLGSLAFGLQAMTLPRPSPGQLMATETMRWLTRHDAVESVSVVDRRSTSDLCVNAVVGPLRGVRARVHGSLLITPHARLVDTRFATFRVGRTLEEEDGPGPAMQALLAGCPRALERRIGRLLDERAPVIAKPLVRTGRGLVRLALAPGSEGLFLLVQARTFTPIAVRIGSSRWTYFAPAEHRDLAAPSLHLPRRLRLVVKEEL